MFENKRNWGNYKRQCPKEKYLWYNYDNLGVRYQKKEIKQLKSNLQNYNTIKKLTPIFFLPEKFPHCLSNSNLCEKVSSILFSLSNQRHSIIVGEDESGITQVARRWAQFFNRMINNDKDNNSMKWIIISFVDALKIYNSLI